MRPLLTFAQAPKRDLQKGKGALRDLWATKIQFISACMDFQMLPKKLSSYVELGISMAPLLQRGLLPTF